MDHTKFHSFFSHGSRIIIILPLVILALGLILKADQQKSLSYTQSPPVVQSTVTPTSTPYPTIQQVPINLKGPFYCSFTGKQDTTGQVFIKNKNIFVKLHQEAPVASDSSYLVKGDCVYVWQATAKQGEKTCKIGSYLNLIDMLANMNLLDINTLVKTFAQEGGDPKKLEEFSTPVCKKEDVDDRTFTIPSGVNFVEKVISPTNKLGM